MRTSPSNWFRGVLVVAGILVSACGSDVGGVPDMDGSTNPGADGGGDGRTNPDGAAPSDDASRGDGAPTSDTAVTSDGAGPDQATPMDTSSRPDMTSQPDVGTPDLATDGIVTTDAPGDATGGGDSSNVADARDANTGSTDASLDAATDAGSTGDANKPDAGDASSDIGPTGPACGNGVKEGTEECDDGNKLDFDGCSSLCTDRRVCVCCEAENEMVVPFCQGLHDPADKGPAMGVDRGVLCQETYACLLRTRCAWLNDQNLMDCYCGEKRGFMDTCGPDPNDPGNPNKPPNGLCMNELVRSMEADGQSELERRAQVAAGLNKTEFLGGGVATWWISSIEAQACPDQCVTVPPQPYPSPFCSTLQDGGADGAADTTSQ